MTVPPELIDFFNVVFRFVHIVAAIMWIGNSLLFTWMEINLIPDKENPKSLGYMNMLHGGGVFFLEKRVIEPEEIPDRLHRFLWQSYTTWISGFVLLVSVFYTRGGSLIVDPGKSSMTGVQAAMLSLACLIGGWLFYDNFWKTPIKKVPMAGIVICLAVVLGFAAWLDTMFNSRFTYLQIGAMLGTIMSANVFFRIIPGQRKMMEALLAGKEHDLELGRQAKIRSKMNHYITFPVIFLMLSAHFPTLYAADRNIIIMGVMIVCLIVMKHMMNIYRTFTYWLHAMFVTFFVGLGLIALAIAFPSEQQQEIVLVEGVTLADISAGKKLFSAHGCTACHQAVDSAIAPSVHRIYEKEVLLADGSTVIADDKYLRQSILNPSAQLVKGYPAAMPSFAETLSSQEVDQLVAYIKSLQ